MPAQILQRRLIWSGFSGGPGYTVLNFRNKNGTEANQTDATAIGTALSSFVAGITGRLPTAVTVTLDPECKTYNHDTGVLSQVFSSSTFAQVGSGTGGYAAPTGALIRWNTGLVLSRKRTVGRTFLVPIIASAYDTDGTLLASHVTAIQNAASGLVAATSGSGTAATDLVVWRRPWSPPEGYTGKRVANVGAYGIVTSATAVDKAVVLRSRRPR